MRVTGKSTIIITEEKEINSSEFFSLSNKVLEKNKFVYKATKAKEKKCSSKKMSTYIFLREKE